MTIAAFAQGAPVPIAVERVIYSAFALVRDVADDVGRRRAVLTLRDRLRAAGFSSSENLPAFVRDNANVHTVVEQSLALVDTYTKVGAVDGFDMNSSVVMLDSPIDELRLGLESMGFEFPDLSLEQVTEDFPGNRQFF